MPTTPTTPSAHQALLVLLAGLMLALSACTTPTPTSPAPAPAPAPGATPAAPPRPGATWPAEVPTGDPVSCPPTTIEVATAQALQSALDTANRVLRTATDADRASPTATAPEFVPTR